MMERSGWSGPHTLTTTTLREMMGHAGSSVLSATPSFWSSANGLGSASVHANTACHARCRICRDVQRFGSAPDRRNPSFRAIPGCASTYIVQAAPKIGGGYRQPTNHHILAVAPQHSPDRCSSIFRNAADFDSYQAQSRFQVPLVVNLREVLWIGSGSRCGDTNVNRGLVLRTVASADFGHGARGDPILRMEGHLGVSAWKTCQITLHKERSLGSVSDIHSQTTSSVWGRLMIRRQPSVKLYNRRQRPLGPRNE